MKPDFDALVFSVKTFCAAMLAYYLSLQLGLEKPFWAIGTCYIVSQTSAGATLSRGLYRFAGTFVGALATVAIVPTFVGMPLVLAGVMACWISFCLYLSLLDRTPRAYGFVLSGYTASLIGFPAVAAPGSIFDVATLRLLEISLGIGCAVLLHGFVFPRKVTEYFRSRVYQVLSDAQGLASDVLAGQPSATTRRGRQRLAADLLELQGIYAHVPFDPAHWTPRRATVRLLHDRLARMLPIAANVEDRLAVLRVHPQSMPPGLGALLIDTAAWLKDPAPGNTHALLLTRVRQLGETIPAEGGDRHLTANLIIHLEELVLLVGEVGLIGTNLLNPKAPALPPSLRVAAGRPGYVFHRDRLMALRLATGTWVGIFLGCLFWFYSAWPDGAAAISILGVCCTLFGNVDSPAPNVTKYLAGSVLGVLLGMLYSFAILPKVSDFPTLVAVLAPAMLLIGSMQARPPLTLAALGCVLTFPLVAGLNSHFASDFGTFINTSIALLLGTGFAVASVRLFQTVRLDSAIERLLNAGRRDIALRAAGGGVDEASWTSLMIDRTALLLPRMTAAGDWSSALLEDTIRDLGIGHSVAELHRHSSALGEKAKPAVDALLAATEQHYRASISDGTRVSTHTLLDRIDLARTCLQADDTPLRDRCLQLMIDFKRSLMVGGEEAYKRNT